MRVLIVEDDHFFGQQIAELLRDRGVEIVLSSNAQDAFDAPVETCEGAVIDVMLPNDPSLSGITNEESRGGFLTGVCVARRLRSRNPLLKIVLLSSSVGGGEAESWAKSNDVSFLGKNEGRNGLLRILGKIGLGVSNRAPRAFIVHGHDEVALMQLKDYLQNTLKWPEPIILRDQPNAGKTIIESFEEHASDVDGVFVLLTPDDTAVTTESNDGKRRSRQNVIFEMGYFCGAFGRRSGRVILLHKGPIELPSDIGGLVWIDIAAGVKAAGEEIRKEVSAWISP
jgi:CheY-like chemotaxis protein